MRRVTLRRPDAPEDVWAWEDIVARLDAVRIDAALRPPSGPAATRGRGALGTRTAPQPPPIPLAGDPPGTPPIVARPDMPGEPQQVAGPPPKGQTVDIPPLDPVYHSLTWLRTIRGRAFHGEVLDGLAEFYR